MNSHVTYKDAGVDLELAGKAVQSVASIAKTTFTPNVLTDIGLFGGCYKLDLAKYKSPVLVSSIDGVGTKLKIAIAMGKHNTVGEDLVNHCVNDIMTTGAEPLFFLDYIGTKKLSPSTLSAIVEGMARGCCNAQCALIGGETAEMPGFYTRGEYDLVGSIVGIVDREKIINGSRISKGDILLGLHSTGLHTNGFSLARKVLLDGAKYDLNSFVPELGCLLGEELLRVHKSYYQAVLAARELSDVVGISHITGGGIEGNTCRLLHDKLKLHINWDSWEVPPIFRFIQSMGKIEDEEMRRVFNLGVGIVFVVQSTTVSEFMEKMTQVGEQVFVIGEVIT